MSVLVGGEWRVESGVTDCLAFKRKGNNYICMVNVRVSVK